MACMARSFLPVVLPFTANLALAPIGDLFASMIKRDLEIKDTGTLFGPHGGLIDRLEPVIVVLDALALGFLCTVGASAALSIRLSPIAAVFIGSVTAAGGLVLRDLLAGDAPTVLRPGVFTAAAAFFGALAFVLLVEFTDIANGQPQIIAMLVVFVVRLLAIRLAWRTRPARDLTTRLWDFWAAKSGDGGT